MIQTELMIAVISAVIGYMGALVPSLIDARARRLEALKTIADARLAWIQDVRGLYAEMMAVLDLFPESEEEDIPIEYKSAFYKARYGLLIRFTHPDEAITYPSDKLLVDALGADIKGIREHRDEITDELRKVALTEWKKVIETTGKAKEKEIRKIQNQLANSELHQAGQESEKK